MDILLYNFTVVAIISVVGYFVRKGLTNLFILQDKVRPYRTFKSIVTYIALICLVSVVQLYIVFDILDISISKPTHEVSITDSLTITFTILTLIFGLGVDGIVRKDKLDVTQ